jgi:hypothetical protein
LLVFFGLLILVFSEIDDLHDRGADVRDDFNEVKLFFPRHLERLLRRHNSNLPAVFIDQSDRRDADIFIDSGSRPAELLRTATKKSSSDIFDFSY